MADDSLQHDEPILRDHLAIDRTRLANERTLLAYLRTSLMLVVTGATAIKFVGETPGIVVTGWLFVGLGAFVAVLGSWRFEATRRATNRRTGEVSRRSG